MKKDAIKKMLSMPRAFPLELTLTTREKYVVPHPDYIYVHPEGTVYLFDRHGPATEGIDHRHIVKFRPLRRAS